MMDQKEFASLGGKARAKRLSKERRSAISREAARARWKCAKVQVRQDSAPNSETNKQPKQKEQHENDKETLHRAG